MSTTFANPTDLLTEDLTHLGNGYDLLTVSGGSAQDNDSRWILQPSPRTEGSPRRANLSADRLAYRLSVDFGWRTSVEAGTVVVTMSATKTAEVADPVGTAATRAERLLSLFDGDPLGTILVNREGMRDGEDVKGVLTVRDLLTLVDAARS